MFEPKQQPQKGLFNPLSYDFSYKWLDDYDKSHILTIRSREVVYFDESRFRFMLKHLSDAVLEDRGGPRTNWEDDIAKVKEEITIKDS